MAGATVLLVERFDPQSAIESIVNHGVTVVSGAPTMWAALAALPGTRPGDLATVRLATSGAAKLDPQVQRAIADRFGVGIVEGYGLTEASPVVTSGTGLAAPGGQHRRAAARACTCASSTPTARTRWSATPASSG